MPATQADGKWRIQQTTVTAIPKLAGESFYALVVIQDVTELTQRIQSYQKELKQRQLIEAELKRSNAELEQFGYIASHDLQEPLRTVNSFTQLLSQKYYHQLDDQGNQIIDFIVDGATRMQALIKDWLNYSRVHRQGKLFEPTDCGVILDRAISNLEIVIQESNTKIYSLQEQGSKIPVIVLSADIQESVSQECLDLGAAIILRKPPKAPEILDALEKALSNN
ncbi:MAG: hypothetical protein F6K58_27570 [Symploca sp. SIO2E9]|nr:hypothetical protein [Symploca sp. SIO2E9]